MALKPGQLGKKKSTSVTKLLKNMRKDGSIKLFGCRCGMGGKNSIAQVFATHFGVPCSGYTSKGGTFFTQDKKLAQGKRKIKKADIQKKKFPQNKPTWLIPADGKVTMKEYKP